MFSGVGCYQEHIVEPVVIRVFKVIPGVDYRHGICVICSVELMRPLSVNRPLIFLMWCPFDKLLEEVILISIPVMWIDGVVPDQNIWEVRSHHVCVGLLLNVRSNLPKRGLKCGEIYQGYSLCTERIAWRIPRLHSTRCVRRSPNLNICN